MIDNLNNLKKISSTFAHSCIVAISDSIAKRFDIFRYPGLGSIAPSDDMVYLYELFVVIEEIINASNN